MEEVRKAFNQWAAQYDSNKNRTRDLEAIALRKTLAKLDFETCLEIGCGTGKNTEWLVSKCSSIVSVDLSEEMLAYAKAKVGSTRVSFLQADINLDWHFTNKAFDLITFSLVLEHIENLDHIFEQAAQKIAAGGKMYIGELHPFKQYQGTKARFETEAGTQIVTCFNHHVSDFVQSAGKYGFVLVSLEEWFDDEDRTTTPRILTLLFNRA